MSSLGNCPILEEADELAVCRRCADAVEHGLDTRTRAHGLVAWYPHDAQAGVAAAAEPVHAGSDLPLAELCWHQSGACDDLVPYGDSEDGALHADDREDRIVSVLHRVEQAVLRAEDVGGHRRAP